MWQQLLWFSLVLFTQHSSFLQPLWPKNPNPPWSNLLSSISAANHSAHFLRQEVWSQCEPGDREPTGLILVRTPSSGNTGAKLLLGEHVRWAGWCGQPLGYAAHVLPLLLTPGPGQSRCLSAGEPEGSQLQVCFVNTSRLPLQILTALVLMLLFCVVL